MFEATIELLTALSLIALTLVIVLSIVGSVVAALRAVRRATSHVTKQTTPLATRSSQHTHFDKRNAVYNK